MAPQFIVSRKTYRWAELGLASSQIGRNRRIGPVILNLELLYHLHISNRKFHSRFTGEESFEYERRSGPKVSKCFQNGQKCAFFQ